MLPVLTENDKGEVLKALCEWILLRNEQPDQYNLKMWIDEFDKKGMTTDMIFDAIEIAKTKPTYGKPMPFTDFIDYYTQANKEAVFMPRSQVNKMFAFHFKANFQILDSLSRFFFKLPFFSVKDKNKFILLLDDAKREEMQAQENEKQLERLKNINKEIFEVSSQILKNKETLVKELREVIHQAVFPSENPTEFEKELCKDQSFLKTVLDFSIERFLKKHNFISGKW